jgi:hypothetical protein
MRAPAPDALIWHRRDALDLASTSISLTEAIMSAMRRTSLLHSGCRRNHLEHRGWLLNEAQVKPARTVYTTS